MPSEDEWNWLFNLENLGERIVHPDDEELDHEWDRIEPNEYETDPQYGSLNRFPY